MELITGIKKVLAFIDNDEFFEDSGNHCQEISEGKTKFDCIKYASYLRKVFKASNSVKKKQFNCHAEKI